MSVNDFFVEKIIHNLNFTPTLCQEKLFSSLACFVTQKDDSDILVVSGYAGTGKTSAIASFVKTLHQFQYKYVLLAPTGRSAKVLSNFTNDKAYTIHKHIYRQKSLKDGVGQFKLNVNKAKDTFFIVDEASLITINGGTNNIFGSGDLLDDLITFVKNGVDNKLIIIGDKGQLPPIGLSASPALDLEYMKRFGKIFFSELTSVVRQANESGILKNATIVRNMIEGNNNSVPKLIIDGFNDVENISGGDLIGKLGDSIDKFGLDNVIVLCRSNKRANRYNSGIRSTILFREEKVTKGDKLMVVKNCYQFLENIPELDFIANGDVAELIKISKYEIKYGINFAEAILSFPDYNDVEITAKVILDTLESETPSLSPEIQKRLFEGVYEDYAEIKSKRKRFLAVREDAYFNALQVKYASAITCHKSQGGQWPCVFIDNPFWNEEISIDDLKWLYTAITRAVNKVFFVNFKMNFFKK
ncbi:MAG: AAA family ATPase [Bacteroidales bacterium]|nr:AAA family ATPase [Bacteroidales bacterium]